jgi:hypothetical protein
MRRKIRRLSIVITILLKLCTVPGCPRAVRAAVDHGNGQSRPK